MRTLRNNLVVGVILSAMLSSTAFANSLIDLTNGHAKEANMLIDAFNKSAEEGDLLHVGIQNATERKNAAVYQDLRSLFDALNQRFKENVVILEKLQVFKNSDCALALADTSKSVESEKAIVACYELTDSLGAATDARGAVAQGLDVINNAMSKYVAVLEAAKAAAAKAAATKKITITCIKGKLTKKVTAVKPVCPTGYRKK